MKSEKLRKKCVKHIKKKIAKKDIIYPAPLDDLIYIGNYKCHLNALSYTVANIKTVKAIIGGIQLFSDDVVATKKFHDYKKVLVRDMLDFYDESYLEYINR